MKRYRVVLVLTVALVVLAGCQGKQTSAVIGDSGEATEKAPSGLSPDVEPAPPGMAKVGDHLTAGAWGFSVTEISTKDEAPGQLKAPEGQELLYVQVSLSNAGGGALEIDPADFTMKDAAGKEFKTFAQRQGYNAYKMTPLQPDFGTSTAFIYAVDPGSSGFTFTFAPEVDGAAQPLDVLIER